MSTNVTQTVQQSTGGLGIGGILTIIFVVAKIAGYIDWSWWWVFAPLWLPALVLIGGMFLVCVVLLALAGMGIGMAGLLDWFDRS